MARGFSPKLPISTDKEDGYALNKTYAEVASQNLKHLILTAPGERIMDTKFGVGIRNYLFEPSIAPVHSAILLRIREQTTRYLPYLKIQTLLFSPDLDELMDPNMIKIKINYFIEPLQIVDVLNIMLNNTI